MPNIDLSILNQRQTPAFYADTLANRPAAGFVGRIFVSTNTFAFYRDNGTGWDLIGGPGTGTITGSGATGQIALWNGASTIAGDTGLTYDGTANSLTASKFIVTGGTSTQFLKGDGSLDSNTYNTGSGAVGQVTFWNGTNAITGGNDLFWDSANGHLGVNTNVPGTALDVHHDQPTVAILNQTVATNDVRIGFQNNGVGLWRIGAFYNAGANDFEIFDVVGAIQSMTVKKTTGQVLIGTTSVGSGKLVVASSTGDNGIQIVGATAPSLRIDSAASGPTKRAGLGISTATNNFIQGSADRDFCIFNGSTAAASPILFGIYDAAAVNVQEAARISPARNFLIGTTTDAGQKLQVSGTALIKGASGGQLIRSETTIAAGRNYIQYANPSGDMGYVGYGAADNKFYIANQLNDDLLFVANNIERMRVTAPGNVGIGTNNPLNLLHLSVAANNKVGIQIGQSSRGTGLIGMQAAASIPSTFVVGTDVNSPILFGHGVSDADFTMASERMRISTAGNLLIGTTTDNGQRLQVNGATYLQGLGVSPLVLTMASANPNCDIFLQSTASANPVRLRNGADNFSIFTNAVQRFTIKSDGIVNIVNTPVYATNALALAGGLVAGDIYKSATGVLSIVF